MLDKKWDYQSVGFDRVAKDLATRRSIDKRSELGYMADFEGLDGEVEFEETHGEIRFFGWSALECSNAPGSVANLRL